MTTNPADWDALGYLAEERGERAEHYRCHLAAWVLRLKDERWHGTHPEDTGGSDFQYWTLLPTFALLLDHPGTEPSPVGEYSVTAEIQVVRGHVGEFADWLRHVWGQVELADKVEGFRLIKGRFVGPLDGRWAVDPAQAGQSHVWITGYPDAWRAVELKEVG